MVIGNSWTGERTSTSVLVLVVEFATIGALPSRDQNAKAITKKAAWIGFIHLFLRLCLVAWTISLSPLRRKVYLYRCHPPLVGVSLSCVQMLCEASQCPVRVLQCKPTVLRNGTVQASRHLNRKDGPEASFSFASWSCPPLPCLESSSCHFCFIISVNALTDEWDVCPSKR